MLIDQLRHVMVKYSDRKCYLEDHHLNEDLHALLYKGKISSISYFNGVLTSCKQERSRLRGFINNNSFLGSISSDLFWILTDWPLSGRSKPLICLFVIVMFIQSL